LGGRVRDQGNDGDSVTSWERRSRKILRGKLKIWKACLTNGRWYIWKQLTGLWFKCVDIFYHDLDWMKSVLVRVPALLTSFRWLLSNLDEQTSKLKKSRLMSIDSLCAMVQSTVVLECFAFVQTTQLGLSEFGFRNQFQS
jgi:hypothetical protein